MRHRASTQRSIAFPVPRRRPAGVPPLPNRKEGEIQKAVLAFLRTVPGLWWRQNTGRAWLPGVGGKLRPVAFGIPGLPDILGCTRLNGVGVMVGVEVKRLGSPLRPEQLRFRELLEHAGGHYIVARSVEDVSRGLTELRRRYSASQ